MSKAVNLGTLADDISVSNGKISVSGLKDLEISGENPIINLTDTGTNVTHKINADSSIGQFILDIDRDSNGSNSRLSVKLKNSEKLQITPSSTKLLHANCEFRMEQHSTSENAELKVIAGSGKYAALYLGDADDPVRGGITMDSSTLYINGYNNNPRFYITSNGLINAQTNSTIQGKYIYIGKSAGIGVEVNILAPDGITPLRSVVSTNTTYMIIVEVLSTGTTGAYCIYAGDMRNEGTQATSLTHIAGNNALSSNRPYMGVNSTTQDIYVSMNHPGTYDLAITVILNGGISGKSY